MLGAGYNTIKVRKRDTPQSVSFCAKIGLQVGEQLCPAGLQPPVQHHTADRGHQGDEGQVERQPQPPGEGQVESRQRHAVSPAAQQGDHHGGALLDGSQLVGPGQVGHLDAQEQPEQGREEDVEHGHQHQQHPFRRGSGADKLDTDTAEQGRDAGQQQLYGQFCFEHLPRGDGQGLHQPQMLRLQGDGGGGHVVHSGQHTDRRTQQHSRTAGVGEDQFQCFHGHAALHQQGDAAHREQEDAQAAVEHVVGAGEETTQLFAQQGAGDALAPDGLFSVLPPSGLAGGGDDAQKAPGEHIPQQGKQDSHCHGEHGDSHPVPLSVPAEQVQGVGRALHLHAVDQGVGHQVFDHGLGFKVEEVVGPQSDQGDQGRHDALVLQLQADLRHHPAQHTGEDEDDDGEEQHKEQGADDDGRGQGRGEPVDDDGREDDHGGVHQTHQVDPQQPGDHDGAHRDGHGQEQVVVLGQIQPGVGVEHAAEGPQQDGQQTHDAEVHPAHVHRHESAADGVGQQGEHPAHDAHHEEDEKGDEEDGGGFGAGFILLGVVEIAAEYLANLLFQQCFDHYSPSSSRKTSSRLSSPLTSSMVPERMSLPALMMATLSHSFSATSSTWVEKKMAPPASQTSRIMPLSRWDALGSRPTKGSSMRMSLGVWIQAEMMASFCFMPWE